ncbi:hypothetical protein ACFU5D_16680 [Streptomyces anthocyanicus]|uniref:hypothetical protein n=1 Tax=Streptomyces anthocyanicus TaxID=68174 RepID=UPI0036AE13C6
MSQPTPPMPDFPPTTAPKKSRTNAIIIGAAVAIIAAIIGTGVVVVQNQNGDSKPAATAETSTPAEDLAAPAVEETEDPEPAYAELTPADFEMKLRTTRRQCFGSAGCNLTVEPDLTYTGLTGDIDPDAVYDITYEIKGDESGPVIATAELSNETSLNYRPSLITTVSSGTKVSVKITDVVMQAG